MGSRSGIGLLATIAFACGPYQPPSPVSGGREATIGCYRLALNAWPDRQWFPDSTSGHPPSPIQLHRTGELAPRWRAFGPKFDSVPGTWHLIRTDSLVLDWSNGMGGVTIRVGPRGDSLTGAAIAWFAEGEGGISETTRAVANRRPCS